MNRFLKIGLFFVGVALVILSIGFIRSSSIKVPFLPVFGPGIYDFTKNLTGGYQLYRNSSVDVFIAPAGGWNDETAVIPSKVLKVNTYKGFIIAEREVVRDSQFNSKLNSQEISDKDFWILGTDKNLVLSNLNFDEYTKKLDSLGIPKNIELIDVYKY